MKCSKKIRNQKLKWKDALKLYKKSIYICQRHNKKLKDKQIRKIILKSVIKFNIRHFGRGNE